MKITKFEELTIWQDSLLLAKEIYLLTNEASFSKDFGFKDQIRRAVISVGSNIVEGYEKNNNNEFGRFLRIAKGSLGEVKAQLYLAKAIGYIPQSQLDEKLESVDKLSRQIGAFISYLKKLNNSD